MGGEEVVNLVAPCAACYLVLNKTQHYLAEFKEIGQKIHAALSTAGLHYDGRVRIRHPLDVLVNDFGLEKIKAAVKRPLNGLKVASYYGCQIVRPYSTFDDQYNPTSMDKLMESLGAKTVDWPLKTRCCGGSLTGTIPDVGGRLSYILLKEAKKHGANVVATGCPLCQFNLECYQGLMAQSYDKDVALSALYFTQLLGTALGIDDRQLGMQRLFVPLKSGMISRADKGGQHARA
jgi:heterodisulfide reductase subunit B